MRCAWTWNKTELRYGKGYQVHKNYKSSALLLYYTHTITVLFFHGYFTEIISAGHEMFSKINTHILLRVMTPCNDMVECQHSGGPCCFHLHPEDNFKDDHIH